MKASLAVKGTLVLALALSAAPPARAGGLEVGLRAGLDASRLRFSQYVPGDAESSPTVGRGTAELFVKKRVTGGLFVESGLRYVAREGAYREIVQVYDPGDPPGPAFPHAVVGRTDVSLRMLEVPLLFGVELGCRRVRPRIVAGLDLGIFLSAEDHVTATAPSGDATYTLDVSQDFTYRNLSLGGEVGVGVVWDAGRGTTFHVDARAGQGFTNLRRQASPFFGIETRVDRDLKVLAGVGFAL